MKAHLLIATAILALSAAVSPALAQQTASATTTEGPSEIIVTAQRRAQSVLDVPLSISALSAEQLANRGIRDLTALQFTEPGFLPSDSVGYTQIFVRGVGNAIFGYADPTVPIYVDDVPRLYPSTSGRFFDVERLELLKGAQGGLYGRNATGGVLNIVSRQPDTEEIRASGRFSYGEKETFEAAGYVNIPLIREKVALSIAGQRNSHDPYVKNVASPNPYTADNFPAGTYLGSPQATADFLNSTSNPPKGVNDQDLWMVGGKLLLQPNDKIKVTIAADYSRKHDSAGEGLVNRTPGFQQATLGFLLSQFLQTQPMLPPDFVKTEGGKFTNALGVDPFNNLDDWGVSGTLVWSAPTFDLTSISAYREQEQDNFIDINFTNVPFIENINSYKRHFFYQELRAVSNGDGPVQWLGGATYLKNRQEVELTPLILPPLFTGANTQAITNVENWTVYAQLGYDLTDYLNLTVSGRYIHEKNTTKFPLEPGSQVNLSEDKFLPSATLSYRLAQGGTIYARWARGFKAGGVNGVQPPSIFPSDQGLVFDPEQVDTFEAGVRASLFDRKVQLTTAIFYNDYKNLQVTARATPQYPEIIFAIVNAPKARTWGVEGSLTWQALDALTLGVNAGYLNAKYIEYKIDSTVLQVDDLSGTRMINSPEFQMSFFGDIDLPLNDKFRLLGSLSVSHVSDVRFQQSGLPGVLPDTIGPAYWLANARLGVQTADDRYGLAIFANNLFNSAYYVAGSSSGTTGTTLGWGNPRIVGAEVTVQW